MITATTKLLSEFEALRTEEKQEFVREIIQHLPPWDSGPLSDDVAAAAGDQLAALHDEEERAFLDAAKSGCSTAEWSKKSGPFSSSVFRLPIPTVPWSRSFSTALRFAAHSLKSNFKSRFLKTVRSLRKALPLTRPHGPFADSVR